MSLLEHPVQKKSTVSAPGGYTAIITTELPAFSSRVVARKIRSWISRTRKSLKRTRQFCTTDKSFYFVTLEGLCKYVLTYDIIISPCLIGKRGAYSRAAFYISLATAALIRRRVYSRATCMRGNAVNCRTYNHTYTQLEIKCNPHFSCARCACIFTRAHVMLIKSYRHALWARDCICFCV